MTDKFTQCPGTDCPNKVKVFGNREISFCCANCWDYSWAHHSYAIGISDTPGPKLLSHSAQCVQRQQARTGAAYEPEPAEGWIMSGPKKDWQVQR